MFARKINYQRSKEKLQKQFHLRQQIKLFASILVRGHYPSQFHSLFTNDCWAYFAIKQNCNSFGFSKYFKNTIFLTDNGQQSGDELNNTDENEGSADPGKRQHVLKEITTEKNSVNGIIT